MPSFRIEPEALHGLAGRFGDLMSELETVGSRVFDIGDVGDASLTDAIERFLEQSRSGLNELVRQLGEVQRVLVATSMGYRQVDSHVAGEATKDLAGGVQGMTGQVNP